MMSASANKIYLSKSNRAMNDDVRKVRDHIRSLGYQVVEYNGGQGETYNREAMLECQTMIMVGYDFSLDENCERFVGKGQYDQLKYRETKGFGQNYYMETNDSENGYGYYVAETSHVTDENSWAEGYGSIMLYFDEELYLKDIGYSADPFAQNTTAKTEVHGPVVLPYQITTFSADIGRPKVHLALYNRLKK